MGAGWQVFVFDVALWDQPPAPAQVFMRHTVGGLLAATPGAAVEVDRWIDLDSREGVVVRQQGGIRYIAVEEPETRGAEGYLREFEGEPGVVVRGGHVSDAVVPVEPPAATTCTGYHPSRLTITVGSETFDLGESEYAVTTDWIVGVMTARTPVVEGCVAAGGLVAYEVARRRW